MNNNDKKKNFYLITAFVILASLFLFIFLNGATKEKDENQEKLPFFLWEPEKVNPENLLTSYFGNKTDFFSEKKISDLDNDGKEEIIVLASEKEGEVINSFIFVVGPDEAGNPEVRSYLNIGKSAEDKGFILSLISNPHFISLEDLNGDRKQELILYTGEAGAYISGIGVFIYNNNKLDWAMLEDYKNMVVPAIFQEGASVRHSLSFKTMTEEKSLAQISGELDAEENWQWVCQAYQWNGEYFKYSKEVSDICYETITK